MSPMASRPPPRLCAVMIRLVGSDGDVDEAWAAWQATPWGRIRYRVMAETLRRALSVLGEPGLRILDIGGADGADCIPLAVQGHQVTVLDKSPALLARARERAESSAVGSTVRTVQAELDDLPGSGLGLFDLVLCHNVLQYHPDPAAAIAAIAPSVRSSGLVSLMCPNPAADVLGAAIRLEDPERAMALIGADTAESVTFAMSVLRVELPRAVEGVTQHDFDIVATYGLLAVTTYIANDGRKYEADFYRELEALELALCDREPYVQTARFWQLVARKR